MGNENKWEKFYEKMPSEKIPWQTSRDDFLAKLIKDKKLGSGSALDLGCGTGIKLIALSRAGFKVVGVDISKTAITYAKANAKKANQKIKFYCKDATDLSFLKNQKFDLILDWANLHGIPKEKQQKYVSEIAKHTKRGSKIVLRCFSKDKLSPMEIGFITVMGPVYLFNNNDIKKLYSKYFNIIKSNKTKASNHAFRYFNEYLMEKK